MLPTLSPRAEATRAQILDAAAACFAERGFNATTTRVIAERAGVSQALLRHYFRSKDALFTEVLQRSLTHFDARQQAQWARAADDVGFFAVGLPLLFDWLGSDPQRNRIVAWARLEGREIWTALAEVLKNRIHEKFVAARRAGILRADVDLVAAQVAIDALLKGYWERRDLYRRSYAAPDVDRRFRQLALRLLLEGILTPEAAKRALALIARSSRKRQSKRRL